MKKQLDAELKLDDAPSSTNIGEQNIKKPTSRFDGIIYQHSKILTLGINRYNINN